MNLLHSGPLTIFLGHQLSPERKDTVYPPILLVLHTLHRLSPQTSPKLCPWTLIGMNSLPPIGRFRNKYNVPVEVEEWYCIWGPSVFLSPSSLWSRNLLLPALLQPASQLQGKKVCGEERPFQLGDIAWKRNQEGMFGELAWLEFMFQAGEFQVGGR